jgi:Zn-dependent protease with chaperone function
LKNGDVPDVKLETIDFPITRIRAWLEQVEGDHMTNQNSGRRIASTMNRVLSKGLACLLVLWPALQAGAQSAGPVFPNPGKTSMSRENQQALGMEVAGKVYEQMPVLPDSSPETQYVRQLGQKLVATIPKEYSWPFEFHVVPQKEINAFALPGGQMFINIGTITAATNESELAGVMGHEMAHVYMQHSAKQAGKAQTTSMIAGIASIALGASGMGNKAGGLVGQLGQMGIKMGSQGLMMNYSRSDESQADAVGAVILYKAGYNPQGMADFFKTMQGQGGEAPPEFFSSHPSSGNRQQAIQKQIKSWPPENYTADSPAFVQTRQHAAGVKAYTAQEIAQGAKSGQWAQLNQRSGALLNQSGGSVFPTAAEAGGPPRASAISLQAVAPSKQMVATDIGPMKMQRPDNWLLKLPEQQGQFVTIAPKAGVTGDGVGYGLLLNGLPAQQVQGLGIDEATGKLVQVMQQNNGLQPVNKAQPITVGGIEGRSVMLQSPSPFPDANGQPQQERDWLITVPQRDGALIYMIFVAPEADFAHLQPTYEAMLKSVQFR